MTRVRRVACLSFVFAGLMGTIALAGPTPVPSGPPAAPKQPVVDKYFGISVTDDYRWLEDWSNNFVKSWSEVQNRFARRFLTRLPQLSAIRERVRQLESGGSAEYYALEVRGGTLFAMKRQPPKQQPFLVALKSPADLASERVLLDPNTLDKAGTTRIDFFVPSLDGSKRRGLALGGRHRERHGARARDRHG